MDAVKLAADAEGVLEPQAERPRPPRTIKPIVNKRFVVVGLLQGEGGNFSFSIA